MKIPSSSPKTRPSSDPAQIIVVSLIIPAIFYVCLNNPYIISLRKKKSFHFLHKWLCILNIVVYIAFFDKVSLRYKFTCYKISTCTILNAQFSSFKYIHKLHNHHHYLILEHIHNSKGKLCIP